MRPYVPLIAAALVASVAVAEKKPLNKRIARQNLAGIMEGHVRTGTNLCAAADSVEAAELLLEVLNRKKAHTGRALSPGHYRDIVWEGLVRIRDKYAQDRIERELRTNRRNKWVRQWCAELLGIYGGPRFGPTLTKATADSHPGVRRWAARSLGLIKYEKAESALMRLRFDRDIYVRANAIEALARLSAETHRETFMTALREDADGGVRCALLGAAWDLYGRELVPLCEAALADGDWRPRMRAVLLMRALKTKPAVAVLIEATRDGRPVVAEEAIRTLQRWTGKEIRETEGWRMWWEKNRKTFAFPEGDAEVGPDDGRVKTVAYGIPLVSDHVAFVIDKSARMVDPLKATGTSKDKAAYEELARILTKLRGRLVFNTVCYREDFKAYKKEPVPLDEQSRKGALRFVAKQETKGAKDIWRVLDAVVSDPTVDTVYLLSSGEPDVGLYVHWNRVTDNLRDLNRWHMVTVHTVVYSGRKWYRDQLEKIAQATGGDFKWFE